MDWGKKSGCVLNPILLKKFELLTLSQIESKIRSRNKMRGRKTRIKTNG